MTGEVRLSQPADTHDAGPIEIRDSRTFYASWGALTGLLAALSIAGGSPLGLLVFGSHAVWSVSRLLNRRVRLRITEAGIENRTSLFSPGLIAWDEVRDVRPAKWGLIDIDLVDEGGFLDRLGSGPQFAALKLHIYGFGPAAIRAWGLGSSRRELLDALEWAMDSFVLSKVRSGRALGPVVEDPKPGGGRERRALFR